eukprot:CAMPEP_0184682418 /NCGR_PEP_ID=MMETSP0312-20130426/7226_1 /TAXON_ID=31354 /ORGANISM="Compsopogon coeruleus, Strain SAG 36.94" /LENGTH=357 /DNA_ID=CAMNT_0027134069 /DNA_START=74 /DNA_END=1147 /DNA_ORIENTATION=+
MVGFVFMGGSTVRGLVSCSGVRGRAAFVPNRGWWSRSAVQWSEDHVVPRVVVMMATTGGATGTRARIQDNGDVLAAALASTENGQVEVPDDAVGWWAMGSDAGVAIEWAGDVDAIVRDIMGAAMETSNISPNLLGSVVAMHPPVHSEVRLWPLKGLMQAELLSAQGKGAVSGRGGRKPDYHANVGKVIETLRADYPEILTRDPDFSIYTDNILFRDRVAYDIQGKDAYASFFWALRLHCRIFFSATSVEITSLFHDDREGIIHLRWRMWGLPRLLFRGGRSSASSRGGCPREDRSWIFDGMSIYRINNDGFVYEHDWDNNVYRRTPSRALKPVWDSVLHLGGATAVGPTYYKAEERS